MERLPPPSTAPPAPAAAGGGDGGGSRALLGCDAKLVALKAAGCGSCDMLDTCASRDMRARLGLAASCCCDRPASSSSRGLLPRCGLSACRGVLAPDEAAVPGVAGTATLPVVADALNRPVKMRW